MKINEIKPRNVQKVIEDILALQDDFTNTFIGHKIIPGIAGFYGELIAWQNLKKHFDSKGYTVRFGSGQSRADLVILKGNKKINIEIKTSRLKDEPFGHGYGFAINIKRCLQHSTRFHLHPKKGKIYGDFCYFHYLFLIALPDNWKNPKFYILPRKLLEKNKYNLRNKSKRFSSHSHRVIFWDKLENSEEITNFDRLLMKNKRKYRNAWHLIK